VNRSADIPSSPTPGTRRPWSGGRRWQWRPGVALDGVAGGVGGDERDHLVGCAADHLLRDVPAQAQRDEYHALNRQDVEQGEGVLDGGGEGEVAGRGAVAAQVGATNRYCCFTRVWAWGAQAW
jgi:hypothetical protein